METEKKTEEMAKEAEKKAFTPPTITEHRIENNTQSGFIGIGLDGGFYS